MKISLRILVFVFLVTGTSAQGFDLADALGDLDPTPEKPKEQPKAGTGDDFGLDLGDALGPDPKPTPDKPAVKPPSGGGGGFGFDLEDAFGPDPNPTPKKPAVKPPSGGGGGAFGDSDLVDISGGDYKPEGGHSGGYGGADQPQGGADQPQESGSGPLAGIISAVGVALLGAASSYFAYQKKKLCFKVQGGVDPESGKRHQGQSDPQAFSNLLRMS